jgi:hypothetical protein
MLHVPDLFCFSSVGMRAHIAALVHTAALPAEVSANFRGIAPCTVILKSMQVYRVHDGKRNVLRALIVSGVFAAVIALIGRCEPVVLLWL